MPRLSAAPLVLLVLAAASVANALDHHAIFGRRLSTSPSAVPVSRRTLPAPAASQQPRSARASAPAASFCQPTDACWPTPAQWAALNATVGGRLSTVTPYGQACYNGGLDTPACQSVFENFTNPVWRADQPSAMQSCVWEADLTTGANCYSPESGAPCSLGSIPTMAVTAQSTADVAAALAFASANNIRVVVKASGHEFQGRSTAAGALLVWLHEWAELTINDAFLACPGDAPASAVTVTSGTTYGAVYNALLPTATIVGGSARTVSAAGGHALGGGHSFLSPMYGLTVDNILQFEAVLANGTVVIASACSEPDLFWALRGGGGSTFAVVTRAVHRIHPTPPSGVTGIILEVALLRGPSSVVVMLDEFLAATPALVGSAGPAAGAWGGYFQVTPTSTPTVNVFGAALVFNGSMSDAKASMAPFLEQIHAQSADLYVLAANFSHFPTFEAWHISIDDPNTGDRTGLPETIVSRLVPMSATVSESARLNASIILATIFNYTPLIGHLVAGGAVSSADPDSTRTSVTPAWRHAAWHMCIAGSWPLNATLDQIQQVFTGLSSLGDLMRDTWPDSGAYFSESDYLEPNWQRSFWGDANYARLQAIKKAYDPRGVFTCHNCVELPSL
jgi:FAD/FMN-containing dehydrogenase